MEILAAIVGGLFVIGAAWYAKQNPSTKKEKANRIKILEDELNNDFDDGIRSLKVLKAKAGLSEQDTRDLLIEMGAKQKKMSTGEEGWTKK